MPRIDDFLDQLSGNSWFSTLDLFTGYWQVEVEEGDRPKTAFATRRGLFQFRQKPFGLCTAPATFQRLMETVLAGLQWEICLVYLDDVIVFGKTFEGMLQNLRTVFDCLANAGLKLKPKKCALFSKQVRYLGHVISGEGVATDPEKVAAVAQWPTPISLKEVRSFLGLCGYYRRYIEGFASIAKCLHSLSENDKPFVWSKDCQEAFDTLKGKLTNAPILAHPDFSQPFTLDTDASNQAIGAVLSQNIDGKECVIAYASRVLTKAERRYCVTRKELLAIVTFVTQFRHYLCGRKFKIRTDHGSLRWLLRFKNPEGQLARWLEILSSYDMDIEHRAGVRHQNADALSRIPCRQCGFDPHWEDECQLPVRTVKAKEEVLSEKSLQELQDEDSDIAKVKQWVQTKERPPFDDIRGGGYYLKLLWIQFKYLQIIDGLLCRMSNGQKQAVVPKTERRSVLQQMHDSRSSAHLGCRKTIAKLQERYYWPDMKMDARNYVKGCDVCLRRKGPVKTKRAPMKIVEAGIPMERIATDILGELPETESGNRYILVISDYYTKWTESFPMPNMEARTVARIIVEKVITRFGVPSYIHSDQGKQYEGSLFHEMCRLLGIKKTRTTPYHPQSDGMVERFNRTLTTMLSAYVNEHHSDWDTHLQYVMMAYRSARHETTGFTPNKLMLGREVSTPLDIMYEMPMAMKRIPTNKWVWELQEKMEDAHKLVRRHVRSEMVRQKRYHDEKLSWEEFKEGDSVYIYFPTKKLGHSPKFTSHWRGPYNILRRLSNLTYEVDCGQNNKPQIVHVDRIRRNHRQQLRGEQTPDHEQPAVQDGTSKEESELVSEVDSSYELVSDGDSDDQDVSSFGRKRRAPTWLNDYVRETFI